MVVGEDPGLEVEAAATAVGAHVACRGVDGVGRVMMESKASVTGLVRVQTYSESASSYACANLSDSAFASANVAHVNNWSRSTHIREAR